MFASTGCSGTSGVGPADGATAGADQIGAGAAPSDGSQNGDETDVDCGGSSAPKCADGKRCKAGTDCTSGVCGGGTCKAPAPDDGVKNGDETDVDCGGAKAPKCEVGKACAAHADCASDACAYDKTCVAVKSCTGHFGGDTCGAGETGAAGAKHESCCARVDVTDRPAGSFSVDKYQVTAGRMRAFVERWKGDLKAWAATNPPGWDDAWNDRLPASMDEAHFLLGPGNKRGCNVKSDGGRTYWQPAIDGDEAEVSDFSKDVLDEKGLNCVPWHLAQALCVSDGGRLATSAELRWLFENGGTTAYPWQHKDSSAYNPNAGDERLAHYYSYATPNPPAGLRMVPNGGNPYPLDKAFYVAPPGRHPGGANRYGVEDVAGNLLMWVDDGPKRFLWTMSWERHNKNMNPQTWNQADGPEGYYAIGARCARSVAARIRGARRARAPGGCTSRAGRPSGCP